MVHKLANTADPPLRAGRGDGPARWQGPTPRTLNPNDAEVNNDLAGMPVTCADIAPKAAAAIGLAPKAIEANPKSAAFHTTRGLPRYRAGR
jgi:hypothetical protein